MNKKKFTIFAICNSLVCLIIGAFIPLSINNFYQKDEMDENMIKFMEIYDLIKDEWYFLDEGDEEEYIDRALNAMVNDQNDDKYLHYYPASDEDNSNQYGIGISVTAYDGYLKIKDVFNNSPASKAGLTSGMLITKVNGQDIFNKSLNEVSPLISGPIGSKVNLTILDEDGTTKVIEVTRNEYHKQSVFGSVEDGIGTIRITGFENGTVSQVEDYLNSFKKLETKDIIIDLRDNGGGYIYAFKEIADFFMPKGLELGTYIHKDPRDNEVSYTREPQKYYFDDIYILINQNSASASESFTASMMDNLDNVTVVGLNSYGKGIAQKTISFSDGSSLKYTYAEYLRPDKNVNKGKVHELGIQPDKLVKDEGNYKILEQKFNTFEDVKKAHQEYFNKLLETDLTDSDIAIVNKGLKELDSMENYLSFSNEVKNMLNRLIYDERSASFEVQMNKVKDLIKGE